jgi:peptide/nickel transport system substrate-binding protein
MNGSNYWQRRLSRRRALKYGAVGGAGIATLALAGCGDDDDDDGSITEPTKAIEEKEEEVQSILHKREDTTAKATKGGIFQGSTTADVTNLDPLSSPSFTANVVGSYIYPRLLSYKPGYKVPARGEVQGYLAATYEQPEPTRLILKLQPAAVWDDKLNKRPIDAEDVVFSWEKFAAKAASRKDLARLADNPDGPVESVKAVDKTTVELKLAFPYAPLLSALAYSRYVQIMPRESEGGYDPRNETRSGGPWMLTNYQRNVIFQYRKNPNYWDKENVLLDGFDYPIIPEYASGLAQFRAKKVWSFAVRQEDIIDIKKSLPDLAIDQLAFNRTCWLLFFGLQPGSPFLDERVRQAASMLIDRDLWIDTFNNVSAFAKEGFPTDVRYHSHISSGWEGIWLDPKSADMGAGARNFQYNVAEAKKLLAAAGYGNGVDAEIAWIPTGHYGTTFPKHAEVFKGMLEADGLFKLKQVNPEYQTEYLPKYYFAKGDFKGIAVGASTQYPDVDQFLYAYYHSKGARQKTSFQGQATDARSDQLIEQQRRELDPAKRIQIIKDWQRHTAEKMPVIPYPGQSPAFSLFWPWIGNNGVFRAWDAESGRETTETKLWFDQSKFTG